jgi:hypothetical protein
MMTTVNMSPPSNGSNNSISFNGRTYSSTAGIPIPVPDFDVAVLQANGWVTLPVVPSRNATTIADTSGVHSPYYFQGLVKPNSPSTAIVPVIHGEAVYPAGASPIGGGGHVLGVLGHFTNNNGGIIPLAIGVEGKIDNAGAGTIGTAIANDCNLSSNNGAITALVFNYCDVANNAGPIAIAAGLAIQVDANTGSIGSLSGLYVPTLTAPGTITALHGMLFGNNPAAGIAVKHCILCLDAGADINTLGPIITAGKTTTATFQLDTGTKTATAVAGAATLNKASGKITTEALTTAAGASYSLTLTNSAIAAADMVFASLANGSNSAGDPVIALVTPGAGFVTIIVNNRHASAALNGNLVISFASMKT